MSPFSALSFRRLQLFCLVATIQAQPAISAVASGASFKSGPVAPGEVVIVTGSRLGPATLLTAPTGQAMLPTYLGATRVLFDDLPAPLLYTSERQVSAITPFALNGRVETTVVVEFGGVPSNTVKIPVANTTPSLFTTETHQLAAINEDGVPNSAAAPAQAESVVTLFGTGAGQTEPPGIDGGFPSNESLPKPVSPLRIIVGGVTGSVLYGGAAPGAPAGVFQLNVRMPRSSGTGQVPVTVVSNNQSSQSGPTITVASPSAVELIGITLTPQLASGGTTVSVTATLSAPAPAGGTWVALASNDPAFDVPSAILVPTGANSVSVPATVPVLSAAADIVVAGSLYFQNRPAQVRVVTPPPPAKILGITSQPTSSGVDITVRIATPAPAGGISIALTSNTTALSLPASITIPAGSTVGHVLVPYSSGAAATGASIQAVSGSSTVQTVLGTAMPGWASDSATDANRLGGSDSTPNLIMVGATVSNSVVTLHARFTSDSYDSKTVSVFSLDTDRNSRTGWQGNYPDGSDPGLMGTDVVVATGGCYGTKASLYRYNPDSKLLRLASSYAVVNTVPGGFDIQIPVFMIGSADFNFRVETWSALPSCGYAGASDAAPDMGNQPARSATVDGRLPAPEVASSSDQIQSGSSAMLSWNAVTGAQFYILVVDETRGDGFSSDQTGLLWLLTTGTDTTQQINFNGQAPARWRVWAVDSKGQAGAPSDWH